MLPDWSAIITKSVNVYYTAEQSGYIFGGVSNYTSSGDAASTISINDVSYKISAISEKYSSCFATFCLPIVKGDKYILYPYRTGNGEYLYFIPQKGV